MSGQDEHNDKNDQPLSDDALEATTSPLKAILFGIGGLMLVLSIFILLPMFFTYLSEGDTRAPSEIHPTDSARKSGQNAYDVEKPEK